MQPTERKDIKFPVTFYKNIYDIKSEKVYCFIDDILPMIATGKFKDLDKKQTPAFTPSGIFKEGRKDSDLMQHNGLLCQDLDNVEDIETVKEKLRHDPYVFAIHKSYSGNGLAVYFKINQNNHTESFNQIAAYLEKVYDLHSNIDPKCKNLSRLRILSHDPHVFYQLKSKLFKCKTPTKREMLAKRNQNFVITEDRNKKVIDAIIESRIDVTSDYSDWCNTGFCIANEYGETGRDIFDQISQFHPEYNTQKVDKKYTNLLKTSSGGLNMGVLYNIARRHGIEIYTKQENESFKSVKHLAKAGANKEEIKEFLLEKDVSEDEIEAMEEVLSEARGALFTESNGIIGDLNSFIQTKYNLKRNLVSRNIELDVTPINDIDINSIFLDCKANIDDVTKDLTRSYLFSKFIQQYNPFFEFIEENENLKHKIGAIDSLSKCITTDTANYEVFLKKWLVGIVSSVYGDPSPLMLVLCGGQNTGKTYLIRHLLPKSLLPYFADCRFQNGKDDEILMTKKLLLNNDELTHLSKKDETKLKELLSRNIVTCREPYGTVSVDLKRLAVFAGTSNKLEILTDLTGNRRVIPINVLSIDHAKYNAINKDELFMEIVSLYESGFSHHLTNEEISLLNSSTKNFEEKSTEEELILKFFSIPEADQICDFLTASEIVSKIKIRSTLTTYKEKIGLCLKNLGFEQVSKKMGGNSKRVYKVIENT